MTEFNSFMWAIKKAKKFTKYSLVKKLWNTFILFDYLWNNCTQNNHIYCTEKINLILWLCTHKYLRWYFRQYYTKNVCLKLKLNFYLERNKIVLNFPTQNGLLKLSLKTLLLDLDID